MHFYTKQLKILHPNKFVLPTSTDVRAESVFNTQYVG